MYTFTIDTLCITIIIIEKHNLKNVHKSSRALTKPNQERTLRNLTVCLLTVQWILTERSILHYCITIIIIK